VTVAALKELADAGTIKASVVADAIAKYELDADAPMPTSV
jgi:pyruvate dehydrogenase E1 component